MPAAAVKKKTPKPITRAPSRRKVEPEPKEEKSERPVVVEILALALVVFAVFLSLALYSEFERSIFLSASEENFMGPVGERIASVLVRYLGWCSVVTVLWAVLLARSIWIGKWTGDGKAVRHLFETVSGSALLALSAASLAAVFFGTDGGGTLGTRIAWKLIPHVNIAGAALFSFSLFAVSLVFSTGVTGTEVMKLFEIIGSWSARWSIEGLSIFGSIGKRLARIQYRGTVLLARLGFSGAAKVWGRAFGKLRGDSKRENVKIFTPELVSGIPLEPTLLPVVVKRKLETVKASKKAEPVEEEMDEGIDDDLEEDSEEEPKAQASKFRKAGETLRNRLKKKKEERDEKPLLEDRAKTDSASFQLPPVNLLVQPESSTHLLPKKEELQKNCRQLERTLLDFKITGKVIDADPGPVITLYQFEPGAGIKVQRIINLADDLALALKVASVRVYAPVPGKGTVGIEVPNTHREIVRLRDLISGERYQQDENSLTLALGKDTAGDPYVADLGRMPHLLIAGATGTGKSVCINSLLLSLLYRNSPDEMRLILIDPKMLELSVYEDIPHLKAPVVTMPKRARGVLWWAVEEMERRYKLMMDLGVRNLDGYNKAVSSQNPRKLSAFGKKEGKVIELEEHDVIAVSNPQEGVERELSTEEIAAPTVTGETLPRIVIVVDELADLMLTVGREVEELVTRLAQKARASGIHLILATQRPSVDVITGLIKANFPARISFKVASRIDARTVMDASGAEKLLGQGDMLFMTAGAGRPKRIHSAFVSDSEVHDVCEWLRSQGAPDYDYKIEEMIARMEELEKGANGGTGIQEEMEFDPLYDQAVNMVIEKGHASTSMVQRVFRIGYNRAARILESMEREGVVGAADGAKPRQVLLGSRDI